MRAVREHFEVGRPASTACTPRSSPRRSWSSPRRGDRQISFAASGTSADNTGATLLEQAEAAGLTPEYGCRMGICFSCTQVKTSGCTRNIRTGETNSDPDAEIQLCINVPVGDVAIDL